MKLESIQVRIEIERLEQLRERSLARRVPVSEIVRESIELGVELGRVDLRSRARIVELAGDAGVPPSAVLAAALAAFDRLTVDVQVELVERAARNGR